MTSPTYGPREPHGSRRRRPGTPDPGHGASAGRGRHGRGRRPDGPQVPEVPQEPEDWYGDASDLWQYASSWQAHYTGPIPVQRDPQPDDDGSDDAWLYADPLPGESQHGEPRGAPRSWYAEPYRDPYTGPASRSGSRPGPGAPPAGGSYPPPRGAYPPARDSYAPPGSYAPRGPAVPRRPQEPRGPRETQGAQTPGGSLARSTGSMAIGTLISRVTGFLRTAVTVYALGAATPLGNAYTNSNTLPNAIHDLVIGGILTSVVVPLLVRAARGDPDRGEAYSQRMFTMGVLVLGFVTVAATLGAGVFADIYASAIGGPEHHLIVTFAYFFIPQVFFYGMSSLIAAILNARNSFAAPMWTPIINNVVVIAVGLLFAVTVGLHTTLAGIPRGGIVLLGVGTTLGIVVQTVALFPALRRVGFRMRPRFDFQRAELGEIGRLSIWMVGYVVTTQITLVVTQNVANAASVHVPYANFSAYQNAYTMFLLPYSVVGVSVITALVPRMSRHAAARKYWLLREDFSYSIRLSSVILVPSALILAVLGPALCELFFSYGRSSPAQAQYVGETFAVFSLGLVPFVVFQLMLRVFYAMNDSRTPAIIGFWTMVATVAGELIVLAALPAGQVVIGLAAVYGITSVFSAALAGKLLLRCVGSLDGRAVVRSLTRMHVATVPGLIFAVAVTFIAGTVLHPGAVYGLVTVGIGGGGALLLYLRFARTFGVEEIPDLVRTVTGRFSRGSGGPGPSPARER